MLNIDLVATLIALLTFFGISAMIALSLNLEYGLAGVPNFGQALFVSVGAYTAGVTYTRLMPLLAGRDVIDPCGASLGQALGLRSEIIRTMPAVGFTNFAVTLVIAALIGGVVGYLASYPALRLKEEWYLALVLLVGSEIVRIIAGTEEHAGGRPHIAVLAEEGSISMEAGGIFDSGGITASAMIKTVRRLKKDDSVKAVVLRVDSPGGSALASDLIWHELVELNDKKPLIASVGSMAASGGYYLIAPARKIVAEKSSIVGSIGVLGGKIVIGDALAEYGVSSYTFPASPDPGAASRAAYLSALTTWDDATRERVRDSMHDVYDLFLDRVSKGRKMPVPKVHEIAQGRIWSGAQGKKIGLVDELGGLSRAIQIARDAAGLDDRAPVVVEGGKESMLSTLLLGEDASESEISHAVERVTSERKLLMAHVPVEYRRFFSSLSPLAARETTLAALPFGLVLR